MHLYWCWRWDSASLVKHCWRGGGVQVQKGQSVLCCWDNWRQPWERGFVGFGIWGLWRRSAHVEDRVRPSWARMPGKWKNSVWLEHRSAPWFCVEHSSPLVYSMIRLCMATKQTIWKRSGLKCDHLVMYCGFMGQELGAKLSLQGWLLCWSWQRSFGGVQLADGLV